MLQPDRLQTATQYGAGKIQDTDTRSEYVNAYLCIINSVSSKTFYGKTKT